MGRRYLYILLFIRAVCIWHVSDTFDWWRIDVCRQQKGKSIKLRFEKMSSNESTYSSSGFKRHKNISVCLAETTLNQF